MLRNRLVKDKVFLLAVAVTLVLSVYISLDNAPTLAEWAKAGDDVSLENCCYNLASLLGLIYASFVSLFLGVEHSDGTLRNKLIAGHSRYSVFFSSFIVSAIGCLIIMSAWLIGSLPGLFYFDGFSFGWKTYVLYALVSVCGALLHAAVFSTMSILISNKAVSAVASLILWFAMLFIGNMIINLLNAPEMIHQYICQGDTWVLGDPYPNPRYLGGMKRNILEGLSHIIPVCSSFQMVGGKLEKPIIDIVYSLIATVLTLCGGCIGFKNKDLK